jgi:nucleoside-diphosphate-sugar epimerase
MVVVTGGSGRAGSYIMRELAEHGRRVRNVDRRGPEGESPARFYRADVTDLGQTVAALEGAEAVVHLAAIVHPLSDPPQLVFHTNAMSTWNILQAAELLKIPKLVLASSINAMGMAYSKENVPPRYLPVDEEHPTRAEDSYSLSKWIGEQIADGFARRRPVQIASFRFHGLWDTQGEHARRRSGQADPAPGAKQLWGYTDLTDAARACRMALEADWPGHEVFFITAADTALALPTREAIAATLPGVPLRAELPGYASAFDCSKAERLFGWQAEHSWRRDVE